MNREEWPNAMELLIAKLQDAGLYPDDAREWVTAVYYEAGDRRAERIAQAIQAAKPPHVTRNYTEVDAAYDDAARVARKEIRNARQ